MKYLKSTNINSVEIFHLLVEWCIIITYENNNIQI